jgi:hypothetical protein
MTVEPSLSANSRLRFQAERMRSLANHQAAVIIRASSAELIETSKDLCLESTQLVAQAVAMSRSRSDRIAQSHAARSGLVSSEPQP